jgi:hypothetical protein
MAAKKWDMAAAMVSHLVKVEPEEAGRWINLACATRRACRCAIVGGHKGFGDQRGNPEFSVCRVSQCRPGKVFRHERR